MNPQDEPRTLTIPTELERNDAFAGVAVLAGVGLGCWYLHQRGITPEWLIPLGVIAGAWALTTEMMADVPFLGAFSTALRRKLGYRRADEWLRAWWHYQLVRFAQRGFMGLPVVPARGARYSAASAPSGKAPVPTAVLRLRPTTNYALASPRDQVDQMDTLAQALMGLPCRVQLIGRAQPIRETYDWQKPPTLERDWLVVVRAKTQADLDWRTGRVARAIEDCGLTCEPYTDNADEPITRIEPDAVQVGDQWCASVVMRLWPREVVPGWLGQALAIDLPISVGIHVLPQDSATVARFLKKQSHWQTDIGPRKDVANELGKHDADDVRRDLIGRTDQPVKVAVVFTVYADSRAELGPRIETLKHEIDLMLGDARPARYEQDLGLEATRCSGRMRLIGAWRLLNCKSVASTWIMQPPTLEHANGAALGTTRQGSTLLRFDPFDPSHESFGVLVIGKVGGGKSFLIKLMQRHLNGVEWYAVEQRTKAEYQGVPNLHTFSLFGIRGPERARALRLWIEDLWETCQTDPRPRALVLDEVWSLLRDPELEELIEEIARMARHYYLSLWVATQQVRELLTNGDAVFSNAVARIYLRQHDRDLDRLCEATGLPPAAKRYLRSAGRGQALIDCLGMLVPLDVQATAAEYAEITTDPRDRHAPRALTLVAADRGSRPADPVPAVAASVRRPHAAGARAVVAD